MDVADPAFHGWSIILAFVMGKAEVLTQMVFAVECALLSRLFSAKLVVVAF